MLSSLVTLVCVVSLHGNPAHAQPSEEWPKVKPGIWHVAGQQIPGDEHQGDGAWNHEETSCAKPESMFTPPIWGEITPEIIPLDHHCDYHSIKLNGIPQFELTGTCTCGAQADCKSVIHAVVTLKSDREFLELWTKRDGSKNGERAFTYATKHGRWVRPCTKQEAEQDTR